MVDGKLVMFEHPQDVWIRHTYDVSEVPQCVSFRKRRGIQKGIDSPPPLYDRYPIPIIKRAKADDLWNLVSKYVPTAYQGFYSELPTAEDASDSDTD